ncbi:unnamed protein product [Clonostachys byssicola]|uniref:2EXR domain-containing protein n=1 Tax=Clonostachys byssicola TaxID=160290 RepID=A0A9N9UC46_9HYPO|nr:unnamed protein product [Clonostachys byssicola]
MKTFHLFPQLPPEIRSQIWHCALPKLKPGVHFFKTGCWTPRELTPSDEDYLPSPYGNCRIKKTWFSIPLLHVDREARNNALLWAGQHHLQLSFQPDLQELGFLRIYDHEIDALYITPDTFESFVMELLAAEDHRFMNRDFSIYTYIDKIIMPESLFEKYIQDIGQIFKTHNLDALYISTSELQPSQGELDPSFQYTPFGGASLSWNPERHRFDTIDSEGQQMDSPGWARLLKEAAQVLSKEFSEDNRKDEFSLIPVNLYEIQP